MSVCCSNQCRYPSEMSLITATILFTCCFFAAANGFITCGIGLWADASCVNLFECLNLVRPLEVYHQTNDYLHRSYLMRRILPAMCGFDITAPKVCCPNQLLPTQPPITEPPVSKHTNCGKVLWNKKMTPDGMPTDLDEFPWLALLEYKTACGRKFSCGGVLISDRHVLTAAQCLDPFGGELMSVRLGEHDLRSSLDCLDEPESPYCIPEPIDVGIEKQMPHEKYSFFRGPSDFDGLKYDIAILKLNRSVITDVVKPICLPESLSEENGNPHKGKFVSAGWGIAPNLYPISSTKVMSRSKQVGKNECDHMYNHALQKDTICALANSPKHNCINDLGGPLMGFTAESTMSVVGIYSPVHSQACNTRGIASTFTDVRGHLDWIQRQMQN